MSYSQPMSKAVKQNPVTKERFVELPVWVLPTAPCGPSVHALAAALTLAELENRWLYLSADTQRRVAGRVLGGIHEVYPAKSSTGQLTTNGGK